MPDQPLTDPIVQLKQSIASLEEQQRTLGVVLSASIQPLRVLLAQLEQSAGTASISNVSGGLDVNANNATIGGDAVGRDKITSHTETNTATDGSILLKDSDVRGDILINSTKIIYAGDDPALAQARLAKYLKHLAEICAPLKLTAIDQGAAQPSTNPLGLTSVYIDLNLDLNCRREFHWLIT